MISIPPMKGRGFISPLSALMIPRIMKTKVTMPPIAEMIAPIKGMMAITPSAMLTRKRRSPWFAWKRANASSFAAKSGTRKRIQI